MMNSMSLFNKSNPRSNVVKCKVKLKAALVSAALLLAFSAQGADKVYDNMHKQLTIMNDIMLSSAKAPQNPNQSLIRSIDSVYLKGQGAIFTIKSAHRGGNSHRQYFNTRTPIPPVAPLPTLGSGERIIITDSEELVLQFEGQAGEFEQAMVIFERQREGARKLHSEQRDIAYEMRDIARQRKDIEYQLQRAEKKAKDELTAELKNLEVERVKLAKNKKQLDQKSSELNKQRKQQKIAQNKLRAEHFTALNTAIVDTLCLYGNGLREVPNKEHVSIIVKGAGNKQGRSYQDQILVFNKKDINACANNKLTAKKLLAKAEQYQF